MKLLSLLEGDPVVAGPIPAGPANIFRKTLAEKYLPKRVSQVYFEVDEHYDLREALRVNANEVHSVLWFRVTLLSDQLEILKTSRLLLNLVRKH